MPHEPNDAPIDEGASRVLRELEHAHAHARGAFLRDRIRDAAGRDAHDRLAHLIDDALGEPRRMPAWITRLEGLPGDGVAAFLRANPRRTRSTIAFPPAPETVREWWLNLDERVQERLIDSAGPLIGNLVGVPEGHRARANAPAVEATHRAVAEAFIALRAIGDPRERERVALAASRRFGRSDRARDFYDFTDEGTEATLDMLTRERVVKFAPWRESLATYHGPLDRDGLFVDPGLATLVFYSPGTDANTQGFRYEMMKARWFTEQPGPRIGMFVSKDGHYPFMWRWNLASRGMEPLSVRLARERGGDLARFANSVVVGERTAIMAFAFSYGSIVAAEAEVQGMRLHRQLFIAGAGLGRLQRGGRFVGSPDVARYAMIADHDRVVGGGFKGTIVKARFGAQPASSPAYTHLDAGLVDPADPSRGIIQGHDSGLWNASSAAMHTMLGVMQGTDAPLEREPSARWAWRASRIGLPLPRRVNREIASEPLRRVPIEGFPPSVSPASL